MTAVITSLVGVLGTLLGSVVTHAFQQRSARRTERNALDAQRRQERLDACGAYAGLLVELITDDTDPGTAPDPRPCGPGEHPRRRTP
ncbi:hypothetical protein ABTX80_11765 [Streptomyces erythrochromogenes]|uniref:hypothetical protein n=1 Tax=Streptomyces erythrochromogenes TaxID=285574 RepID=UPI0033220A0B